MLGYLSGGTAHCHSRPAEIGTRSCFEERGREKDDFYEVGSGKKQKKKTQHSGCFCLACVPQSFRSSETFLLYGILLNNTNVTLNLWEHITRNIHKSSVVMSPN